MDTIYTYLTPRNVWLYVCAAELILFVATSSIAILSALCYDHLNRVATKDGFAASQSETQSACYLVAFITTVITWLEISGRVLCWSWIGYTDQRFWRVGIPALMANAVWAGTLLAMLPGGFRHHDTSSIQGIGQARNLQV
jgi:hypothetical protein